MNALPHNRKLLMASAISLLLGTAGTAAFGADGDSAKSRTTDTPQVVIEEEYWTPLIYEPYESFTNLERYFARDEMKAAAHEIERARTWLSFAEKKAAPITREKLQSSIRTLDTLARDLENGHAIAAAELRFAIASAKDSLAEWHYFESKKGLAQQDEQSAATHLQAAVRYLRNAADDIRFSYPDDTLTWFETIDGSNWVAVDVTDMPPRKLAANLDKLKIQLDAMSQALIDNKAA